MPPSLGGLKIQYYYSWKPLEQLAAVIIVRKKLKFMEVKRFAKYYKARQSWPGPESEWLETIAFIFLIATWELPKEDYTLDVYDEALFL